VAGSDDEEVIAAGAPLMLTLVIVLLAEVTADNPRCNSSPEDFLRIEGNSVTSSITMLNSSISLSPPVEVRIGPAEEEEGLLFVQPCGLRFDDLWNQILTRRTTSITIKHAAMLIVM